MNRGLSRTIRLGISSLMLHKLRSVLTTLGVFLGVVSVIVMLAIGEGASEAAQEQIRQLGSQNVILRSVKPPEDAVVGREQTRVSSYGLTDADYGRLAESFPGIRRVVPVRQLQQEVRYETRQLNPRVLATTAEYRDVTGRPLAAGRFLTSEDARTIANVCVLGYEVARYLVPFDTALGKRIKIGPDYFTCVGVLLPRVPLGSDPAPAGADVTGEVFLPLETGRKWFGDVQVKVRSGSRDMEEVQLHEIYAEVARQEDVPLVAEAAKAMLERNHKQRDYEVVVPLELLMKAKETKRLFSIVLGTIAGVSLLVGGIGIMNVMLATVTERTREIGIRRALGAKRRHIVSQFLVETVVLSVSGGALGVAMGIVIPIWVEHAYDMRTIVTIYSPLLAFGISVLVGIVFGLYPAWRAAHMDPVEALRHE
ncbi:MAG: ABC transporter permease [Planctomycetota bacterium]